MAEEKLTEPEERVKNYLDRQIEDDDALRSFYVPSKIRDCFKYITEQARKAAVNGCAMIEDSVVFKWARDYYIEELPKDADKETVEVVQERVKAEIPADNDEEPEEEEIVEKPRKPEPKVTSQLTFDFGE